MGGEGAQIKKSVFDTKAKWYALYEGKIVPINMSVGMPEKLDGDEYVSVSPPSEDIGIKYAFTGIPEIKIEPSTFKSGKLKARSCEKKVPKNKAKPVSENNFKCEKYKNIFAYESEEIIFYSSSQDQRATKWKLEMHYRNKRYDLGIYNNKCRSGLCGGP